jgi:hypothetical protein
MAENKPGNGYTAPFGDENGATIAGGGPAEGAHDFLTDNESNSPASGARDFTKESRPQPAGGGSGCNPVSIPPGGKLPWSGAPAPLQTGPAKPFKLNGDGGSAPPAPASPEGGGY